ncbi:MAG: cytidyltransferase-like protein [Alphaproteobacteria bacterium]|jgi:cytidyltransferase-like protein
MLSTMNFTVLRREFNKVDISKGTAIVIGNFDGVHKGHQSLISQGVKRAEEQGLTTVLYTFEPHPKKLFLGEKAPKPITPFAAKARILKKLGIELLVARPFTKDFAATHFSDFVDHLKHDLHVKAIVVGEDFAFGKGREGSAVKLKKLGDLQGFETVVVKDVICDETARFSSTRIRTLLADGQLKQANLLLGRVFSAYSFLHEDSHCNLVAHFSHYTPVKNGVYLAKIQYTDPSMQVDSCVVPLKVEDNTGYIPPLPNLPNLLEGKIKLSLIDKIEE